MTRLSAHVLAFLTVLSDRFENREERGATAVEYGLLVGLIAVVLIAAITLLGTDLRALFTSVTSAI